MRDYLIFLLALALLGWLIVSTNTPTVVVCENHAWRESTDSDAQGGDREQICHYETLDGAPIRVVELD